MSLQALLTFATPIPQIWRPGDIGKARPRHFQHPLPNTENIGKHPVVVLTHPDAHGFVKVATVSHVHPFNPPTKPSSSYGIAADPHKGDSKVNVAGPERIHISKLSALPVPDKLNEHHLHALQTEIQKNCPEAFGRRAEPHGLKPDPCDRKAVQVAALRAQAMHEAEHGKITKKRSSGHKSNRHASSHASGSGHK